jgi:hypothetical protein
MQVILCLQAECAMELESKQAGIQDNGVECMGPDNSSLQRTKALDLSAVEIQRSSLHESIVFLEGSNTYIGTQPLMQGYYLLRRNTIIKLALRSVPEISIVIHPIRLHRIGEMDLVEH